MALALAGLDRYKLIAEAAIVVALIVMGALRVHEYLSDRDDRVRAVVVAEYAARQAISDAAAHKRELELITQRDEAINHANDREQTIRTVAAAATVASSSLRDTLAATRNSLPDASLDAARHTADTLATVLDQCQARYRSVAEVADRHASDSRTLSEAWPR